MMRFHQQIVFIFVVFVLVQGKSFSHARQVKELTVDTTQKVLAVEGVNNFSLQKETLPNAAKVKTSEIISGRKMSVETTMTSSVPAVASVGKRNKGDEEKNWKDNFVAFSADYRSPKPHPPKNN